jgi:RNA polymerase sigma factor (sigma-70 family)
MTSDEASVLWKQFRSLGDEECFRRLYCEYFERTTRICRARISSRKEGDARDIAEQVFWYLYRKRPPAHDGFEAMLTYFAGLRCRNFRPQLTVETLSPNCPDSQVLDPSVAASDDDERERIARAMEALPWIQREIVLQHDLEGVPVKAIARYLGISRFKANRLRNKALETLKRLLRNR